MEGSVLQGKGLNNGVYAGNVTRKGKLKATTYGRTIGPTDPYKRKKLGMGVHMSFMRLGV